MNRGGSVGEARVHVSSSIRFDRKVPEARHHRGTVATSDRDLLVLVAGDHTNKDAVVIIE